MIYGVSVGQLIFVFMSLMLKYEVSQQKGEDDNFQVLETYGIEEVLEMKYTVSL